MVADSLEDKYLLGEIDGEVFIRFVGNSTVRNSKVLEEVFDKLIEDKEKDVILEFAECNYMDSTVLGLLAKTAIKMKRAQKKSIYAINIPNVIMLSLKSTGVDKLLNILENKNVDITVAEELEHVEFDSKEEKTKHILDSHKTLYDLNDKNKKEFKTVVDFLEADLNK